MQRLTVNPQTLAMALGSLRGTPEEVAYFATQLQRSCAAELSLYQTTPPADAPPEVIQATAAATGKNDWGDTVHPYVVGQVLVDLCERTGQPIPDNLFVYVAPDWVALHNVQPSAPAKPSPVPSVTPAQLASPAPVDLQRTEVMGATILKTAATELAMPQPGTLEPSEPDTLEGMIEQVEQAPPVAYGVVPVPDIIEDAQIVAPAPAPEPAATPAPAPLVRDEYGLPVASLDAPKGKSPFDSSPGGNVPKSAPDRALRDILTMAPQLFNTPAALVVRGGGKGVVQRQRVFTATLLMVDQLLSSVPDEHVPVGALLHYVRQLRYAASQSAGADVMLAYEQYLFPQEAEEE